VDPCGVEVGHGGAGDVTICVGDMLSDALVRPGRVVVRLILHDDGAQVRLAEDYVRSGTSRRRVPTRRSQIAFIRGAWTALTRILVPTA
jgi:hypothetical protein